MNRYEVNESSEKKISLQQKILLVLVDIRGSKAFCFGGNNISKLNPFFRGFALLVGLALIESFILRTKQAMQYLVVVELLIEQSKPIRKNEQNK